MDKLRRDDVTADFFGPDKEATLAPPGRVAIARDNARLFVGNVINNHTAPPRQDTFDIDSERSSLMTTSGLDPITLTTKVFEAATPVASALRSCQKQAARFKIGALSIASLHTECSAIRTTLLQIKSLLSRDGQKPLTIESGRIILEDYYGVLEFSWLLFNVILKHLRSLGLTQLEGMSKDDFTANMGKFWEYREMDEIIQVLGRQARAVDLFHVAFQSETEHEISAVMKSPEARQVIASISDDTISLHESFCTAPEGAYPPETASMTSGREFGFDQILKSTALYRRASMLAGQGLIYQHQRLFHNANTGEAGPSHVESIMDPRVPSAVPLSIAPGTLPTPQDNAKLPEGGKMISDDDRLSAFMRGRRLSVGSDSSVNTVKAAPSPPRVKKVEPVSIYEGSTKADSLVEPSLGETVFNPTFPADDSVDLYKAAKRRPTLFEVLSRRTTKPYSLFEFYIYERRTAFR
ncbi:hypothetical protein BKA56DRAFT_693938 [Ilyonectria sp. MPI-CAGE-AT-0026]|nr:hypothetical protein BKA56DRAFT_693938 [Ilyonectria sp. MPI-CAGE-AT-0026]